MVNFFSKSSGRTSRGCYSSLARLWTGGLLRASSAGCQPSPAQESTKGKPRLFRHMKIINVIFLISRQSLNFVILLKVTRTSLKLLGQATIFLITFWVAKCSDLRFVEVFFSQKSSVSNPRPWLHSSFTGFPGYPALSCFRSIVVTLLGSLENC